MNLTVALRVIGGFAIITLLLFVISISSLTNLSRIGSATDEVSELALPTLTGSNQLKVAFLNMGRLTIEGYYTDALSDLEATVENFEDSKASFDDELSRLKNVTANQPQLRSSIGKVDEIYQSYLANVEQMFASRTMDLELGERIASLTEEIEFNSDDTSTLILDFAYLDEVTRNAALKKSSEVGGELETNLMKLVGVSNEFAKTATDARVQTLGSEIEIISNQIREKLTEMLDTAGGRDDSGTLDEINEMVDSIMNTVSSPAGLLASQRERINQQQQATQALSASEANIREATEELDKLLNLADTRATEIKQQVGSSVSFGNSSTIVIMLISLAAAGGIGYFSVRAITNPLSRVNDMLQVVSSGDLTRKLDASSKDEFGTLAKNCNELIDSLKNLISSISSRSAQLAAASEQTSTVTIQTTRAIQEQKAQIGQVATATTEMNSTSELVKHTAEDTMQQILSAEKEADKVKEISEKNKNTILVLAKDVEQAAEVINKLNEDSARIGGILDVIRGVADQTNLLALNAAIEAARAGEHGRGFAVVADEVRTLASRTQESTQEIQSMIEILQEGAERAVQVMNQGREQTSVCVEQAELAASALNQITDAVHSARDASAQIEQSAREQNVVSQEISEKLESIVAIAEQTSTGAQQTSDASHEVAKLADELQNSVRQFKV